MAFLSFLTHAVQDLFRLFAGFFIHAGGFDLLLEFSYIRYIFRVHVIQFFLQIVNLLFQGSFPVKLLLIVFLRVLCFRGNFCHFHKFLHRFLNQAVSVLY